MPRRLKKAVIVKIDSYDQYAIRHESFWNWVAMGSRYLFADLDDVRHGASSIHWVAMDKNCSLAAFYRKSDLQEVQKYLNEYPSKIQAKLEKHQRRFGVPVDLPEASSSPDLLGSQVAKGDM